ncbi:hypothetical protein LRC484719_41470 [Mycobacterium riyadhense]
MNCQNTCNPPRAAKQISVKRPTFVAVDADVDSRELQVLFSLIAAAPRVVYSPSHRLVPKDFQAADSKRRIDWIGVAISWLASDRI